MSRNRPLVKPEDGVCPVTGLDVDDTRERFVIRRQMLINSRYRVHSLAVNPRDALMNVAMRIIDVLKEDEVGELKDIDPDQFGRLVKIMNVSSECLSDQDYGHLRTHLRNKGFLQND